MDINCGIPDEYATETTSMAVFTMDNHILADFFETKKKLVELYRNGTIDRDLYNTIIEGQLAKLDVFKVARKTPWTPDGIAIAPEP